MTLQIAEVTCPVCGRLTPIVGGTIVEHGPGKTELICEGSGSQAGPYMPTLGRQERNSERHA